jgi:phospholipid/cholesterol/gamma-HCH transport system substrate-binding protein
MKRVLSLVLALAFLVGVGGCTPPFQGRMTVTALLADSAGLFVGNDVGILGVPVGEVTAIKPEGTHVRVTLEIDGDQAVPADAGAVVVARSVATDRYVELTPVYHSGPRMRDGAVIEQDRTRTPVDFDEVLAALNEFATGISGSKETKDAIKRLLAAGSKAVDGKGEDFNRAITSLGSAVDSISGQRENITATVRSLDTLTASIAQNQEVVRTFITQVSKASEMLADERVNFRDALRSLDDAVTLVAEFAHENRQQVVRSLDQSTAVMKTLLSRRPELAETLRVMPVALQNLKAILAGDRLRVRVDPTVLFPALGGLVDRICSTGSTQVCSALGPSLLNFNNLLGLLGIGGRG